MRSGCGIGHLADQTYIPHNVQISIFTEAEHTDTVITTPISHVGHHVMSLSSHWLIQQHPQLLIGQYALCLASDWSKHAWSLSLIGCLGRVWAGDIGVMCVMSMLSPRRCQVRYVINDTHDVTTTPDYTPGQAYIKASTCSNMSSFCYVLISGLVWV